MKKLLLFVLLSISLSCSKKESTNNSQNPPPASGCGTFSGHALYKDSEGCYYTDSYGYKVYIATSECDC